MFNSGDDGNTDNNNKLYITVHYYLAIAVGIPAVLHGLWKLRRYGTKRLQVLGFLVLALTCAIFAAIWNPLQSKGVLNSNILFVCYLAFVSATNWGPRLTTFVLPQELFKVEIRSTFNGIAAAAGKVGAVLGIWIFGKVHASLGIVALMIIVAALNLFGAVISQVRKLLHMTNSSYLLPLYIFALMNTFFKATFKQSAILCVDVYTR